MWTIWITLGFGLTYVQCINNYFLPRCSSKLENALDAVLQLNNQKTGSSSTIELSPYNVYRPLPKSFDQDDYNTNSEEGHETQEKSYRSNGIEVTHLRARIPTNSRWVRVDKCLFNQRNQTLDTRLVFPDLQISGRVTMLPSGGRCDMILRLRRAEIEFKTMPLTNRMQVEFARSGSVRTESHFTEPGFISVFAHGCEGPTGIKYRSNSKRRAFNEDYDDDNFSTRSGSREYYDRRNPYNDRVPNRRSIKSEDDLILLDNDNLFTNPCCESDIERNSRTTTYNANSYQWEKLELANNEELEEAFSREIEDLFSKGVRGLLTTYMQKALQPAIKETLMESMGYKLSYG